MVKKILQFITFLLILIFLGIFYLSYYGIKTDKFNNTISKQLKENYPNINIEFNEIKLLLNLLSFSINLETKNPKIYLEKKEIVLQKISTSYNILSFFKKEFGISYIDFETKNNKIQEVIKFLRLNRDTPQLYIIDKAIKGGKIDINAKINFDQKGRIKNDYKLSGKIYNLSLRLLNKKEVKNINLDFNYLKKNLNFVNLKLDYLGLKILSENFLLKEKNNFYLIEGDLKNSKGPIPKEIISSVLKGEFFENVILSSKNHFSLKLSKKYKVSDLSIKSKISLEKAIFNFKNKIIKNYIPIFKDKLLFSSHVIDIEYKDKISVKGKGDFEIDDKKDVIKYNIDFKKDNFNYNLNLSLNELPINIDLINFSKKENIKGQLEVRGKTYKNKILIKKILLETNEDLFLAENFELTKNYKIKKFEKIQLNFLDNNKKKNDLIISKNKKKYVIKGKSFDLSKIVDEILAVGSDDDSLKLFDKKNRVFQINFDQNYIDSDYYLINLKGKFQIKNNEIHQMNLTSNFSNNKNVSLSIKSKNNSKVTTFYSDFAKPFVKKYKFIKGFDEGKIDFTSTKIGKISNSKLKIYNFKLKELPALTKILTLASLQGIADILTGEGVRFDEFEMIFQNKKDLIKIEEIYSIGPAISILMEGYVQRDDVVSLRGTLVPATTINKFVGSIPILGKILVGKKTGEGVFGVSFKIKGHPKDLKTTVNPVKTLTPRFITRTLEKIKKTN